MQKSGKPLWFFLPIALILLSVTGCGVFGPGEEEQASEPTPPPVVSTIEKVVAEGKVVPIRSVELRFEKSGTIAEILVEEGSRVEQDTPLARLDTRDLQLAVEQAQANLRQAQADYNRLLDSATPEEIAAAEARVRAAQAGVMQSQGQYNQTVGAVTNEDLAAAQAAVQQARAELADAEDGPKITEVQQSQAALDQAIIDLEKTRDDLSAAKTKAYEQMEVAANNLRDAQANYSNTYWNNREIERDWDSVNLDLPQSNKDKEEQVLRAVESAERELEQTRVNYEQARQAEIAGIQAAEARVRELRAKHEDLIDGEDPDVIVAARARVADAEANLSKLQGLKRAGEIAAAEASIQSAQAEVDRAQADLQNLTGDPLQSDLEMKLAVVSQREVALKQAELERDKATITAPFAGTVVDITPKVGEWFGTTEPAVILADFSTWKVETTDLDELSVVNIDVGSPATLTFDALPDLEIPGRVTSIQSLGENYQGDIVYEVTIVPTQWDERLRWNMTVTVAVEPVEEEQPGAGRDARGGGQFGQPPGGQMSQGEAITETESMDVRGTTPISPTEPIPATPVNPT